MVTTIARTLAPVTQTITPVVKALAPVTGAVSPIVTTAARPSHRSRAWSPRW